MKNILFIGLSLDPTIGGIERVSYTLAQSFSEKGYKSYFLFCNKDSDLFPSEIKEKFDLGGSADSLYDQFYRFIHDKKIDIVICQNVHYTAFHAVYAKIKLNCNIKLITVLHFNPDRWINKNIPGCTTFRVYMRELLRSAYFLIRNHYKEELEGMYKISDKTVLLSERYIPVFTKVYHTEDNGEKLISIVNPCSFREYKRDHVKENIVLVVARMEEQQKRISNILKIWREIYASTENWKLVLVGDGPSLGLYKQMAKRFGLTNVEFAGYSPDVSQYFRKSKIFLTTSIWEGMPVAVLEALHYGCVPIAFDSYAALPDVVEDGKNGFIVELHNLEEFGRKLRILMEDEELRETMADNGALDIESKFDLPLIRDQWISLFSVI